MTVFCLAVFSVTFMATSFAMYRNILGFNQRNIQLWIAWASIGLGGISAVLSPVALYLRRGFYEIASVIFAFLYWAVFILLLHL